MQLLLLYHLIKYFLKWIQYKVLLIKIVLMNMLMINWEQLKIHYMIMFIHLI